ncbi:MAG: cytochrome c biogenesis heme-transporting ATPase CcmA [Sterolibacteriaceae bacterium]|nr:cytochrome c biogenesis heme-transporting ATPase CcmA [Sterolibacteriaceae bacterium]
MLEVDQLACMRGDALLFRGLSFRLEGGALLHVAGRNGAGKTSLLRMLCGLMIPEAGEIRWRGTPIRAQREEYHGELLYLGHANAVKDEFSALENLLVACAVAGRAVSETQALAALEAIGLAHRIDLDAKHLSQGQRRRVALARLLLAQAIPLWILDEPFTALDAPAVALLARTIEAHLAGGGAVIYTTHQDVLIASTSLERIDIGEFAPC